MGMDVVSEAGFQREVTALKAASSGVTPSMLGSMVLSTEIFWLF